MPWIDDVAAVLHQWYGRQECGNALADVFLGPQEPSGRLLQVFPASEEQITAGDGMVATWLHSDLQRRRVDRPTSL